MDTFPVDTLPVRNRNNRSSYPELFGCSPRELDIQINYNNHMNIAFQNYIGQSNPKILETQLYANIDNFLQFVKQ